MSDATEMPDWMPELPDVLARAMTLYQLGDVDGTTEVLGFLNEDPSKQYTACCLLARMIAAKVPPCPGGHAPGECSYRVQVLDPDTGKRREWDDVGNPDLFGARLVLAMLHLDGQAARAVYVEAVKDGSVIEGFVQLLRRAAETVNDGRQSVFFN